MPKTTLRLALLAALFLITSCSDVGDFKGGDQGTSQDMTASMEDMELADADLSSGEDMSRVDEEMGETCTPQTKVSVCMAVCGEQPDGCGGTYDCGEAREEAEVCAEACGSQPDGCGGTIECEPCACEDGQPVQPTCGPCNLGTASCDGQDNLTCLLPSIPDISTLNCELDIIYVSSAYTGTTPLGTRENPFKTINEGLSAAFGNNARLVILSSEEKYEESDTLVVRAGTSLVGGYDSGWVYTPEVPAEVLVNNGEEDSIGLMAQNISLPTLVAHLNLTTTQSPINGNNYGLYANTANRLILEHTAITAGDGGRGANGSIGGGQAPNGSPGAAGLPGQRFPNYAQAAYDCPTPNDLKPDLGGTPIIACPDPAAAGGVGGSGGCTATDPTDGGISAAGAFGGSAGTEASPAGLDGGVKASWNQSFYRGSEGTHGKNGGFVETGWWVTTGKGEDGTAGRHGKGGGGGGGAYLYREQLAYSSGPMGGAGGGGGCAGQGGEGGYGGGSSFGIFVVDSFGLEIRGNSSIFSGNGGNGGDGQLGGTPGEGGLGGPGTDQACEVKDIITREITNCITLEYKSGDGGDGTAGTAGGPGGGGAGGDSYGIYCHGSTIAIDASTTIEEGSPGIGGQGGTYPDEGMDDPDEDGEDGIAAKTFGCN